MDNPQMQFEDSIFGPNGQHPAPKTLPYPTQPITALRLQRFHGHQPANRPQAEVKGVQLYAE